MSTFVTIAGALVVLAVVQDIFSTVLFPASRRGVIRKPVSRGVWNIFRVAGRTTGGQRRRNLLSYAGPAVITATIAAWFLLFIAGWAMVYQPALGTSITAASGPTDESWTTALYFSGFNFTTLGVGDIAARTGGYRLLSVVEAAMGFAVISMVITYFLSVYSSLRARNSCALGLHHRSRCTGDAAELLAGFAADGHLVDVREHFSQKASALREIDQSHRFYPVLRYFHYRDPLYSLPRVLLIALDGAALIRTALDRQRHGGISGSAAIDELELAATSLLDELVGDCPDDVPTAEERGAWRRRHGDAAGRLSEAGLGMCDDGDAADRYVAARTAWDRRLRQLADSMAYEWDDVERSSTSAGAEGTSASDQAPTGSMSRSR